MLAVAVMPSAASRKYSGELNRSANALSAGRDEHEQRPSSPMPAMNEPIAAMLSAAPARPWRAS